jgi:hypothetical protein
MLGECSARFESDPPHPAKEYGVIESEEALQHS